MAKKRRPKSRNDRLVSGLGVSELADLLEAAFKDSEARLRKIVQSELRYFRTELLEELQVCESEEEEEDEDDDEDEDEPIVKKKKGKVLTKYAIGIENQKSGTVFYYVGHLNQHHPSRGDKEFWLEDPASAVMFDHSKEAETFLYHKEGGFKGPDRWHSSEHGDLQVYELTPGRDQNTGFEWISTPVE